MYEFIPVESNPALDSVNIMRAEKAAHLYETRAHALGELVQQVTSVIVHYRISGEILITLENEDIGWLAVYQWDFIADKPALRDWNSPAAYRVWTNPPPDIRLTIYREFPV